jgi:hypothetical protein
MRWASDRRRAAEELWKNPNFYISGAEAARRSGPTCTGYQAVRQDGEDNHRVGRYGEQP